MSYSGNCSYFHFRGIINSFCSFRKSRWYLFLFHWQNKEHCFGFSNDRRGLKNCQKVENWLREHCSIQLFLHRRNFWFQLINSILTKIVSGSWDCVVLYRGKFMIIFFKIKSSMKWIELSRNIYLYILA